MTFYVLFKVFLCGFTAYLCSRVLGLSIGASRFTSIAWMLSGYNMVWCYWNLPHVSGWIPVLLLGVEFLLQRRYQRGFSAMALAATLLLLAGHPETVFTSGLGVGLYFLLRLALSRRIENVRRPVLKPMLLALAAWSVALGATAVQIIPFVEYIPNSQTERGVLEEDARSIQPGGWAALWAPRFIGSTPDGTFWGLRNSNHVSLVYPGVVTWVAASLLLTSRNRNAKARAQVLSVMLPAAAFLLLAFGVPPLAWLRELPGIRHVWGVWFVSFFMFAMAILGGFGLDHAFSHISTLRLKWPVILVVGATAACLIACLLLAPMFTPKTTFEYVLGQVLLAAILGLCSLAIVLSPGVRLAPRTRMAAFSVLLALDLLLAARGFRPTSPKEYVFPETELTQRLQQEAGPIRVECQSTEIRSGILPNYGIETLGGYDGMYPKRQLELMGLVSRGAWGSVEPLCAVSHYLFPEGTLEDSGEGDTPFELVGSLEGIDICRNKRAFPRAFLVGRVRALADADAVLDAMCAPGYDPLAGALTEAPPFLPLPNAEAGNLGTAVVASRLRTRTRVNVSANKPVVLVLADAFYPGWQALVDGEPREVFPVYYAFRGVTVEAGKHTVEFRYSPLSFRIGLAISTVVLAVGFLGGALCVWRRRRNLIQQKAECTDAQP